MQVLNEGVGTWDGSIVNPSNPQRRDVQILRGAGYMVLQIDADNPGAWPLHCHIAWHVSAGLYVTVLERPADIAKLRIPSIMAQTCRDWSTFTNTAVVDQIDVRILFNISLLSSQADKGLTYQNDQLTNMLPVWTSLEGNA